MKNGKDLNIKPGQILNSQGTPIRIQIQMDMAQAAKIIADESCDCPPTPGKSRASVVCSCYKIAAQSMMRGAGTLLKIGKEHKERADVLDKKFNEVAQENIRLQARIKELEASSTK